MNHLVEIYYIIDEIVKLENKKFRRGRKSTLTKSEVLTILVIGHSEGLFTNKQVYNLIKNQYSNEFKLPSYPQFTKAIRDCEEYLDPVLDMLTRINASKKPGLYFIDSTSIPVNGYDSYHNSKWADGISFSKNMHG